MREIIITYNAQQLGYEHARRTSGLEDMLELFTHEPKPTTAIYVPNERYGIELGSVIATYLTEDPKGLLERIKEHYGAAISIVEEGGPMEALREEDARIPNAYEEPDREEHTS
jgi:hypothetical protein